MSYKIRFSKPASKQFKALPVQTQQRIRDKINALENEPRPNGVVKLESAVDLYRIRVGDYRIVYTIDDNILLIVIVKVGHRQNIYR